MHRTDPKFKTNNTGSRLLSVDTKPPTTDMPQKEVKTNMPEAIKLSPIILKPNEHQLNRKIDPKFWPS